MGGVADQNKLDKLENMSFLGGNLKNCHSKNDGILKYAFKIANINSSPIGINPLDTKKHNKIKNYDVTKIVKQHMDYNK